jgi:hypothetical protein
MIGIRALHVSGLSDWSLNKRNPECANEAVHGLKLLARLPPSRGDTPCVCTTLKSNTRPSVRKLDLGMGE